MLTTIESRIAQELSATVHQVAAAVALLDEGATVPFISRYRKEATGGLDDTQLRNLQERLIYLRELEGRRTKAQIAREAGLDSLATALLDDHTLTPEIEAVQYLRPAFTTDQGGNPGVPDVKAALVALSRP
jgi:uncharacterized protein